MKRIPYGEFERIIEHEIRAWAINDKDIPESDYDEETDNSDFTYVDGLKLAGDITSRIFVEQNDGIEIVPDYKGEK